MAPPLVAVIASAESMAPVSRPGAKSRLALVALALAATVPGDAEAAASDVRRLRPGVFLYASPALQNPNFVETVVLLVRYEPAGAMGLIINRPSDDSADEALPGVKGLRGPVYRGGPVQQEALLALVRLSRPSGDAPRILEDVFLTGQREDIARAARQGPAAERVRIYSGYSGWGPGQLENEVRLGAWVVARGEVPLVFSDRPRTVWPRVYRLLERREARGEWSVSWITTETTR